MVSQFRKSTWFKWLVLVTVALELPFCALYFGFPPIQYVMKQENYFYSEKCQNLTTNKTVCNNNQDVQFNWLYLAADVPTYISTYSFGVLLDRTGTRNMRLVASFGFAVAFLIGWIAVPGGGRENLMFSTMFILGIVSLPTFLSNIQVAYLFNDSSDLVASLINGIFDAADGVTYFMKKLHVDYGWSSQDWWLLCLASSFIILFRTMFLMPKSTFVKEGETKHPEKMSNSSVMEATIKSSKFWMFMPWFLIVDLRCKFFLQSLNPWLVWVGDNDDAFTSKHTDLFSGLQIAAILFAPVGGLGMKYGTKFYLNRNECEGVSRRKTLAWLVLISGCGICVFSIIAGMKLKSDGWTLIVSMMVVFFRTNMYTVWNFWIFNEYPANMFGRVCGMTMLVVSIPTFLQQPLLRLAQHYGWRYVQYTLGVLSILFSIQFFISYTNYATKFVQPSATELDPLATETKDTKTNFQKDLTDKNLT